jgi:RNA polymerase sigma-70 factor, ECF subfamily
MDVPAHRAPAAALDDERLAIDAADGCDEAFALLAARWRPRLERYCRRYVSSRDLACDAAQAALFDAYRGLRSRSRDAKFAPWMYAIARNDAISEARSESRRATLELDPSLPSDVELQALVILRHDAALLLDDIQHLSGRQRTVVIWHELSGWSYQEIADELGIRVDAVRQALRDARSTLRQFDAGRERPCAAARSLLAHAGPGRRPSWLQAHLRACSDCRARPVVDKRIGL